MTSRAGRGFPPVQARQYLALAQRLARGSGAADLRSAGDRAYYAAFLFVRDDLHQRWNIPLHTGPGAHVKVIGDLRRIDPLLGMKEEQLRIARNRVTYQTGQQTRLTQGHDLQWMLTTAREIIDGLSRLRPPRRAAPP